MSKVTENPDFARDKLDPLASFLMSPSDSHLHLNGTPINDDEFSLEIDDHPLQIHENIRRQRYTLLPHFEDGLADLVQNPDRPTSFRPIVKTWERSWSYLVPTEEWLAEHRHRNRLDRMNPRLKPVYPVTQSPHSHSDTEHALQIDTERKEIPDQNIDRIQIVLKVARMTGIVPDARSIQGEIFGREDPSPSDFRWLDELVRRAKKQDPDLRIPNPRAKKQRIQDEKSPHITRMQQLHAVIIDAQTEGVNITRRYLLQKAFGVIEPTQRDYALLNRVLSRVSTAYPELSIIISRRNASQESSSHAQKTDRTPSFIQKALVVLREIQQTGIYPSYEDTIKQVIGVDNPTLKDRERLASALKQARKTDKTLKHIKFISGRTSKEIGEKRERVTYVMIIKKHIEQVIHAEEPTTPQVIATATYGEGYTQQQLKNVRALIRSAITINPSASTYFTFPENKERQKKEKTGKDTTQIKLIRVVHEAQTSGTALTSETILQKIYGESPTVAQAIYIQKLVSNMRQSDVSVKDLLPETITRPREDGARSNNETFFSKAVAYLSQMRDVGSTIPRDDAIRQIYGLTEIKSENLKRFSAILSKVRKYDSSLAILVSDKRLERKNNSQSKPKRETLEDKALAILREMQRTGVILSTAEVAKQLYGDDELPLQQARSRVLPLLSAARRKDPTLKGVFIKKETTPRPKPLADNAKQTVTVSEETTPERIAATSEKKDNDSVTDPSVQKKEHVISEPRLVYTAETHAERIRNGVLRDRVLPMLLAPFTLRSPETALRTINSDLLSMINDQLPSRRLYYGINPANDNSSHEALTQEIIGRLKHELSVVIEKYQNKARLSAPERTIIKYCAQAQQRGWPLSRSWPQLVEHFSPKVNEPAAD